MQPTLCSRCHKNVAVIFLTRIEGGVLYCTPQERKTE